MRNMPCPSDCGPMTNDGDEAFEEYLEFVREDLNDLGVDVDEARLEEMASERCNRGMSARSAAESIMLVIEEETE